MKRLCFLLLMLLLSQPATALTYKVVSTAEELQAVFAEPVNDLTVRLTSGVYDLEPTDMREETCGNCREQNTPVEMTVGLHVRGSNVKITAPADFSAIVKTHAGYGIYFEDCVDCTVENLTITEGERDRDGKAADAAVVAKRSAVHIRSNRILENIGDTAIVGKVVVGIMGIVGREDSHLFISKNQVLQNSWDGITLYRDATAEIIDNVVDGVDGGYGVSGGRGVGIGLTWNAKAVITGNLVKNYWKGVGLFMASEGVVKDNVIEDLRTWGYQLWDAGQGNPSGVAEGNVIYNTGACGAGISRRAQGGNPGTFKSNVIVNAAQDQQYDSGKVYCEQTALALASVPTRFVIADNIFFGNRRAKPGQELSASAFSEAVKPVCEKLQKRQHLTQSSFYTIHCQ